MRQLSGGPSGGAVLGEQAVTMSLEALPSHVCPRHSDQVAGWLWRGCPGRHRCCLPFPGVFPPSFSAWRPRVNCKLLTRWVRRGRKMVVGSGEATAQDRDWEAHWVLDRPEPRPERGGGVLRARVGDRRPATGGDNNLSDVFSLSTVSKQFSTLF